VTSSLATERTAFDQKVFSEAQAQGKSILVDIFAPWCPICKAQKPVIEKLSSQPKFKDLVIFIVDFDNQKDAVKIFRAQQQGTLIVFKGRQETGRSVGITNADAIGALLTKAL
jgi:thioredoxin 1